jgi:transcriptional regulator with XRE-family HTH domain
MVKADRSDTTRDMTSDHFAEKVGRRLDELGLSQSDVAKAIGTYQSTISDWVQENRLPKIGFLIRLAEVLGTTLDYLVNDAIPVGQHAHNKDEELILAMARALGYDESKRRLLQMFPPPGHTYEQIWGGLAPQQPEESPQPKPSDPPAKNGDDPPLKKRNRKT